MSCVLISAKRGKRLDWVQVFDEIFADKKPFHIYMGPRLPRAKYITVLGPAAIINGAARKLALPLITFDLGGAS